jgi:hypothetical protein
MGSRQAGERMRWAGDLRAHIVLYAMRERADFLLPTRSRICGHSNSGHIVRVVLRQPVTA